MGRELVAVFVLINFCDTLCSPVLSDSHKIKIHDFGSLLIPTELMGRELVVAFVSISFCVTSYSPVLSDSHEIKDFGSLLIPTDLMGRSQLTFTILQHYFKLVNKIP